VIIATANRKAAMSLPEEETTQLSASVEEQSISSLLQESPVDWEALTHRVNKLPSRRSEASTPPIASQSDTAQPNIGSFTESD
jgi:hypothetical protein